MAKGVVLNSKNPGLGVYITLDRSGSMTKLWSEAIGSINAYIESLKKEETDKDYLTIAVFDDGGYDVPVDNIKLKNLKKITEEISIPRGMTPLFDSVAKTIEKAKVADHEKTVIVIMTDGHENCSREHNKSTVNELIKSCEKKGWEVLFLGANFDVASDATAVGLGASKFVSMNKAQFHDTMADLGSRTRAYSTVGAAINYSAEDKAKASADKS